jgi:hypothetical protein
VVTAINVATGERIGQEAVLGASGYTYMNADNLYLSGMSYSEVGAFTANLNQTADRVVIQPTMVSDTDPDTTSSLYPSQGLLHDLQPEPEDTDITWSIYPPSPFDPTETQAPAAGGSPVRPIQPMGTVTQTVTPGVPVESAAWEPETPDPSPTVTTVTVTLPNTVWTEPTGPFLAWNAPPDASATSEGYPSDPAQWTSDAPSATTPGSSDPLDPPDPQWVNVLTVETTLVRLALNGGALDVAAHTTIPGTIISQFAMDEFEGHLRVAVTTTSANWVSNSALYVFDSQLQLTGKIDPLMEGEAVQSVRFVGPVGYVVTFLQTDPLFTLDLSNPTSPGVTSTLKIPGFSSYLHPWGSDRVLGLGFAGDELGLTGGMKLSVFDVTDPYDVREAQDLALDNYLYSEAGYNHHAMLASESDSLIAFPASWSTETSGDYLWGVDYVVIRDGDSGLQIVATLTLDTNAYQVRGLLIDDDLYTWDGYTLQVHTTDTFARLAEVVVS